MPLIHTVTATEEQVSALFAEMESFPEYEYRGGYGQLCHRGMTLSGFNYINRGKNEWISIEIDRPIDPVTGNNRRDGIKVRLYVDRLE